MYFDMPANITIGQKMVFVAARIAFFFVCVSISYEIVNMFKLYCPIVCSHITGGLANMWVVRLYFEGIFLYQDDDVQYCKYARRLIVVVF